jgi:putative nucleotidyltransferase with HDIG domain
MDIAKDVRIVRFLPAYFSAISHLLCLLTRDEPHIPEIAQAVGADQALASRLLNIVNSPVYGSVRQIGSIDEAVVRIGLVGLRNLALAISMNDVTGGVKRDEWKHSITVAHVSDMLTRKIHVSAEVQKFAFVTGLMHDIGKLFLTRRYMLEYQSVFTKVFKGQTLSEAETSTFGYDHATVGAMLLQTWNVPECIVEAIRRHHDPQGNSLASIIFYANQIIEWREKPTEARTDIDVVGLPPTELEWVYFDAVIKSREMEARIH